MLMLLLPMPAVSATNEATAAAAIAGLTTKEALFLYYDAAEIIVIDARDERRAHAKLKKVC